MSNNENADNNIEPDDVDLTFIGSGRLIEELKKRFDIIAVVAVRYTTETEGRQFYDWQSKDTFGCIGAVEMLKETIKKKWQDNQKESDGEVI